LFLSLCTGVSHHRACTDIDTNANANTDTDTDTNTYADADVIECSESII
jgi:hypothetical protein